MFVVEVAARSARLVEGAQALRAGTITPQESGDLLREGHTIKGTGRVMGYDDVAAAGLMLEMLWRWIQHGDLTPAPIFGHVLEALSSSIPRAIDDPTELAVAMAAVHEFFEGDSLPEELPPVPVIDPAATSAAVSPSAPVVSGFPPAVERSIGEETIIRFDTPAEVRDGSPAMFGETPGVGAENEFDDLEIESHVEEPMSAQQAFAALRRSMQGDEAESVMPDPEQADEAEPPPSDGHPIDDGASLAVPPLGREGPTAGDTVVDDALGSVIEFPRAKVQAAADHTDNRIVRYDRLDEGESSDTSDVVVLPSNARPAAPGSLGSTDLGGLVGAVQTWATEEAISINAGQLYGLVNHIVSLRMDIASVKDQLGDLADVAAADPFFAERVSQISEGIDPIDRASERIEARALGLAAVPLRDVTNTLTQLGRYLSRKTEKEIRIELVGDDVLVDRQVLDRLGDAIRQLVVNAAVHGIEDIDVRLGVGKPGTGVIRVEARKTDVNLEVSVVDDGRGIDWRAIRDEGLRLDILEPTAELSPEALRSLLYQSGFSTSETTDELAGDGAGLAIVREAVDSLNGSLTIESAPGSQTTVSMVVPLHPAMQKALLVMAGGIMWGIPETAVQDVIEMNLATIAATDQSTVLERSDGSIPFASFGDLMGVASQGVPVSIVIATSAAGPVALGVEEVVGTRRVAAKELGAVLADVDAVTGAALLGGEEVVLLVDTTRLAERQHATASDVPVFSPAHVLIVDDSRGVQQVVSSALATSGFSTSVAASVADALGALHSGSFDAVVVDFSMPRADGVALAHMVRQRHGDIPMVMLSGVADGEDVDRAREAGVDAFFDKADLREGGLAEKLRELIGARRAKEQTA